MKLKNNDNPNGVINVTAKIDNEDIDSLTDNFPVVKYNSKIFNMMKEFDAEDES